MQKQLEEMLFAVLFAVGDPIAPDRIAAALGLGEDEVQAALQGLAQQLEQQQGPLCLLDLDGSYQLATNDRFAEPIRKVLQERRSVALSQAALEVLAAVAYNQPVTRAYVEQVRGVDSSGIVSALVEKGLLEEAGRLELPGRPIAYRTTAHFLRTFGLTSLQELPLTADIPPELPEDLLEGQLDFEQAVAAQQAEP